MGLKIQLGLGLEGFVEAFELRRWKTYGRRSDDSLCLPKVVRRLHLGVALRRNFVSPFINTFPNRAAVHLQILGDPIRKDTEALPSVKSRALSLRNGSAQVGLEVLTASTSY